MDRFNNFFRAVFLAQLLLVAACGGGGGGEGDNSSPLAQAQGRAFQPGGGDPGSTVAPNAPVTVRDLTKPFPSNIVSTGTTDAQGRYSVSFPQSRLVAIIIQGDFQVSGLVQASDSSKSLELNKDFDSITDLACRAGVQAIQAGDLDPNTITSDQIFNLEDAADRITGTTVDPTDLDSVLAGVNTILIATDNGKHPVSSN